MMQHIGVTQPGCRERGGGGQRERETEREGAAPAHGPGFLLFYWVKDGGVGFHGHTVYGAFKT